MGYEFHSAQRKPASIRTSRNSSINTNPTTVSDHEQEATELNPVDHEDVVSTHDAAPWTRNGSINSCHTTSDQAQLQKRHWYDFVSRFWRHYIQLSVPHVDCRDHLGMLPISTRQLCNCDSFSPRYVMMEMILLPCSSQLCLAEQPSDNG